MKEPMGSIARKSDENIDALNLITRERFRQIIEEGHTPTNDDEHEGCQLAVLASAYALGTRAFQLDGLTDAARKRPEMVEVIALLDTYGWEFKPKAAIRDLVRAGALIIAELERRLRLEKWNAGPAPWENVVARAREILELYKEIPAGQPGAMRIMTKIQLYEDGDRSEALFRALERIS